MCHRALALLLLGLLGLLGLSGCGSGSSDGGAPPAGDARFLGFYHSVQFGGLGGTPAYHAATQWGTAIGNGAGSLLYGTLRSDDGGAAWVVPPLTISCSIDKPGTFLVGLPWVTGRGGISSDDRLLVFGGVPPSSTVHPGVLPPFPSINLLLRKGTGLSAASMAGSFHFTELRYDIAASQLNSNVGTSVFDSVAGKVTTTVAVHNRGGFIEGPLGAFKIDYTVASDGTLASPGVSSGGMLVGGDFAAIAGFAGGGAPQLSVFVRKATAASVATLKGIYDVVGVVAANAEPGVWHGQGLVALLSADGVGGFTSVGLLNLEGVPFSPATSSGTYFVSADGALELFVTGGPIYWGGITESGRIASLSGGITSVDSPGLFVLSRR